MKIFRKIAVWLYNYIEALLPQSDIMLKNNRVREDLRALEPAADMTGRQREFMLEKFTRCLMVLIIGVLLSGIMLLRENLSLNIAEGVLYRNAYGEGSKTVSLVADTDGKETSILMEVAERSYTQVELDAWYPEFIQEIEKALLGENSSADCIQYDLKLVNRIEGYPFRVEWRIGENAYIDREGHLQQEVLDVPAPVILNATICCESYKKDYKFAVLVYGRMVQNSLAERLTKQLLEAEECSREKETVKLPSEYEGKPISWYQEKNNTGIIFLILTILAVLVIYFGKDKELHSKVELREQEMLLDYSEIVSKLALLCGAGMTIKNAWIKIAVDYRNKRKQDGIKRYAYEEMLFTMYEMESGMSENKAYEGFGKRCKVRNYRKLSALLSQNLRKGSLNLFQLLYEESGIAFEARKRIACKLGEKAGTKLLIPMMMMLIIIMVIIIVPAFSAYTGI